MKDAYVSKASAGRCYACGRRIEAGHCIYNTPLKGGGFIQRHLDCRDETQDGRMAR
jgi:hypothetical protein